jgi:hypothetical protein
LTKWKRERRLSDLEPDRKMEVTCRRCGLFRFEYAGELMQRETFKCFFLDEVEAALGCRSKNCHGRQRLALCYDHLLQPFIAGMP